MGSALSLNGSKTRFEEHSEVSVDETCKRQRLSSSISEENENVRLIPNLPDEISFQILARVPRIFYLNVRLVSRSWKGAIMRDGKDCHQCLMDELDRIPFCGSAIGTVDGCLYVLGGFSRASALTSVWRYDPVQNGWSEVSPMSIGRAYCKTGVLNNKLYVVGGVTRGRGGLIPLQSAEVFDPRTGVWSQIPSMPFAKAQVLPTAFLADLLKPIATGMTSYKGKLFVPQSLYYWPFFVDVGGEVYDPETNSWFEMPVGMGEGWPARQAGTKLGAIVDDELYALDPSSSADIATIKVYDYQCDSWKVVSTDVPIHDFAEAESPYLLASLLGKLHVITKDANNNFTVLQANMQNHLHSFPLTPLSPLGNNSSEQTESAAESETDVWKVIAARSAGACELVSCQILGI
ncbi:unnamed protein product, partial [Vitis vinifera]